MFILKETYQSGIVKVLFIFFSDDWDQVQDLVLRLEPVWRGFPYRTVLVAIFTTALMD